MSELRKKFLELHKALNASMVDREEEVSCVLVAMVAHEHVLFVGPPGTAKSLIADQVTKAFVDAIGFQKLLTKYSEPSEVFGPVSLKGLKDDRYEHVTAGFLPEAHVALIDEIGKAGPAIINNFLTITNERKFDNGSKRIDCPLRLLIGASNEWPIGEGYETCGAMFDRFLIRKAVRYVSPSSLERILWGELPRISASLTVAEWDQAAAEAKAIPWSKEAKNALLEILDRLRRDGIRPSDRRVRKSVGIAQASAWLQGGSEVKRQHLEVLQHVLWEDPIEHPQKVTDVVIDIANPGAKDLAQMLIEVDEIIGRINPREPREETYADMAKLSEIAKKMSGLPGEKAQRASRTTSERVKKLQVELLA